MRKIIIALAALAIASVGLAAPAVASEEHGPKFTSPICHATEVRNDDNSEHSTKEKDKPKVYTFETVIVTDRNYRTYFSDGKLKNSPPDYLGACVVPDPTPTPVGPAFVPAGPGPYLQAYGLVTDPTCQLTVDWAKWEGVPDGGWHQSWHMWMNGGTGGSVCQRVVELVNGSWTVS
jgi:hypothetical protein